MLVTEELALLALPLLLLLLPLPLPDPLDLLLELCDQPDILFVCGDGNKHFWLSNIGHDE